MRIDCQIVRLGAVALKESCQSLPGVHYFQITGIMNELFVFVRVASFGNGKTIMGLEIAHKCAEKTGKPSLICLPLGVRQEFVRDALTILHYDKPKYVRNMAEITTCSEEIMLTNYERVRDGDIDPLYFGCTVLDEAAVLRDYGSKTYQTFLDKFKGVDYKYVMTATPEHCAPASAQTPFDRICLVRKQRGIDSINLKTCIFGNCNFAF